MLKTSRKADFLITVLRETDLTEECKRRFFIAILSDETHGVLRLTQPGSVQHDAVFNVIALLKDNCNDPKVWRDAEASASAAAGVAISVATSAAEMAAGAAARAAASAAAGSLGAAAWAASGHVAATETVAAAEEAWVASGHAAAEEVWMAAAEYAAEVHYSWMTVTFEQLLRETK